MSDPGDASPLDRISYTKFVFTVLIAQFAISVVTGLFTLRDFPNSADEYAYVVSATLLSEGRLSAPSPEPREHFSTIHVVNDGRYYGKYPPGWPGLLAVGVRLGVPWIVNPLLGVLAVALVVATARRLYSEREARFALLIAAGNPFLVFNAASYFAHPASLAGVAGALLGLVDTLRTPESRRGWLVTGCGAALAFLTRPYTAVACLLPAGIAALVEIGRRHPFRRWGTGILWAVAPLSLSIGLFLLYNQGLTGDPLRQPFSHYDPEDRPFLPASIEGWMERVRLYGLPAFVELNVWLPLSAFGLLLVLATRARNEAGTRVLMWSALGLLVAYCAYPRSGGNRYGPRYVFEALAAAIPILAFVLRAQGRVGLLCLAAVLVLNSAGFVHATRVHARQVRARMAVFDEVRRQGLTNAVVFLRTGSGSMPAGDLTRNGTTFDGTVLYVHDLGARNRELLRAHPDRSAYVFEYDEKTRSSLLIPYAPR